MTLPWMAERIQLRAIASLRPHAGNARVHDAAQLAQIMASMQAFGFTNPLLVDENGVLIAGHDSHQSGLLRHRFCGGHADGRGGAGLSRHARPSSLRVRCDGAW
jgi:hypothetical protein